MRKKKQDSGVPRDDVTWCGSEPDDARLTVWSRPNGDLGFAMTGIDAVTRGIATLSASCSAAQDPDVLQALQVLRQRMRAANERRPQPREEQQQ